MSKEQIIISQLGKYLSPACIFHYNEISSSLFTLTDEEKKFCNLSSEDKCKTMRENLNKCIKEDCKIYEIIIQDISRVCKTIE